jgi:3,4-dihydroxy 2-butanone 4-phosphate synthase / GTP cyclohydrolase II
MREHSYDNESAARMTTFDTIDDAIDTVSRAGFVVVVDDRPDGESGAHLVIAADAATEENKAWMMRHASDEIRAATTTLSAGRAQEFVGPGPVTAFRARPGGVLAHAAPVEAAVDLCRLAGRVHVAVIAELAPADGSAPTPDGGREFADAHGLVVISIADLVRHRRRRREKLAEHFATARVPTAHGDFMAHAYRSLLDGIEHVAFVMGEVEGGKPPLVRVHSECLTGDILGSLRCDCGPQLQTALSRIAEEGRGVLVYLRGHEGRGIGIGNKLRAYALQDSGLDTVEANEAQGLPVDSREYGVGANILADLGISALRLMTNNPLKLAGLEAHDLEITEQVQIEIESNPENVRYLETKRDRMGHRLSKGDHRTTGG